jgi:serine/threonine protein kinase
MTEDRMRYSHENGQKILVRLEHDHGECISRVRIPADVSIIAPKSFWACQSLSEVTFESGCKLQRIEKEAFSSSELKKIRIPIDVEILGEWCFFRCKSLSEVTFESGCKLQRIEKMAFYESGLKAIRIPVNVEILGQDCFSGCHFLSEVTFESGCKLRRIEKWAFSRSGLKTIRIPINVKILRKWCFLWCKSLSEMTFESGCKLQRIEKGAFDESGLSTIEVPAKCEFLTGGSLAGLKDVKISERNPFFIVDKSFLMTKDKRHLIWYFGLSESILVDVGVEIIGERCFYCCESLSEVRFESGCKLQRIEKWAFHKSGLKTIQIPMNVEMIGEWCFCDCQSLSEVTFGGKLTFGKCAFYKCPLKCVKIRHGISLDYDFGESCRVKHIRHRVELSDFIVELNEKYVASENQIELGERSGHSSMKVFHDRVTNEEVAVKTFVIPPQPELRDRVQQEFMRETETLVHLDHPCIVRMKGLCLPRENEGPKIIVEFLGGGSLKEVLRNDGERLRWWTPTRRIITVTGIVLGMKYLESKNLIHRDLKPSNILFDDDRRIKICDFGSSRIYEIDVTMSEIGTALYMAPEVPSGVCDGKVDVYSFGLILYEIVVGNGLFSNAGNKHGLFVDLQKGNRPSIPGEVLKAGRDLIEKCWSHEPRKRPNFEEILSYLKGVDFEVIDGVNKGQVRGFLTDMEYNWEGSLA